MAGVRANLARLAEMRLRTDPLVRARSREEVPLASAIGLMVRERLTGEAPPEAARAGLDAGLRLDRGESRRRSRRARPRARRPGGLRRAGRPSCCATSSWSRARPTADARSRGRATRARATTRPRAATRTRRTRTTKAAAAARPRFAASRTKAATRQSESDWSEEEMSRRRRRARRGRRGGHAPGPPEPAAVRPAAAASTIASSPPNMTRRSSARPSCATRRNWGGCAPISTSSSSICRARSPSSPTGCSGG